MLQAELHGKVSSQGSARDHARLEDTLTSAVFGSLQYLPRDQVLRNVLETAFGNRMWADADLSTADFVFWPAFGDGTEPDVLVFVGRCLIVIEAKYGAGFGVGQLEREWAGAEQLARARALDTVLLLAVTTQLGAEPAEVTALRDHFQLGDQVVHLSWQHVGLALEKAHLAKTESRALRDDVLAVMEKRRVRHVYTGIDEEDWWLVSAAQRTARKRVYPQIAALARELQRTLEQDNIAWGVSEDKVVHYHSFSLSTPASWARSYLQLPLWPTDFATDGRGRRWWATFHVLFDFLNAEVCIGYLTRPETVSEAKRDWIPAVPQMLRAVRDLSSSWVLTTAHGNYAAIGQSKHPAEWSEAELAEALAKPSAGLTVERRLSIQSFKGGAQAREMVLETVEAIRARPAWLPGPARSTSNLGTGRPVADDDALEETESEAAEEASDGLLEP